MEHVRSFSIPPTLLTKIQEILATSEDSEPFETSELYSASAQSKILDLNKRRSKFRLWKDPALFELMEIVVNRLSLRRKNNDSEEEEVEESKSTTTTNGEHDDEDYKFLLVKNDITEIHYQEGDFFDRHSDYLSLTSNCIEEFTLVLCVSPSATTHQVEGGDTLIYPFHQAQPSRYDTKTPGRGVLFRKDIDHAGEKIIKGQKCILTANLYGIRQMKSSQVLLVTFPTTNKSQGVLMPKEKAETPTNNGSILAQLADQNKSYALPVDLLKGTMLGDYVECFNRDLQSEESSMIIQYECERFSFEEFGTVVKVLQRSYVHENDIDAHSKCLDFFGPFPLNHMFVNLALEPKGDDEEPVKKQAKLKKDNEEEEEQEESPPGLDCL